MSWHRLPQWIEQWATACLLLAACSVAGAAAPTATSAAQAKRQSYATTPPMDVPRVSIPEPPSSASALPAPDPGCMSEEVYIERTLALLEQHAGVSNRDGARKALHEALGTFYRSQQVKLKLARAGDDDALMTMVARDLAGCHLNGLPLEPDQVQTMLVGLMDAASENTQARTDMATLIALDEEGFRPCDTVMAPSCPAENQDHWLRAYELYINTGNPVISGLKIKGKTDAATTYRLHAYAVAFIELLSYQPSPPPAPGPLSANIRITLDPCAHRASIRNLSESRLDLTPLETTAQQVMQRLSAPGINCQARQPVTLLLPQMAFWWPE